MPGVPIMPGVVSTVEVVVVWVVPASGVPDADGAWDVVSVVVVVVSFFWQPSDTAATTTTS